MQVSFHNYPFCQFSFLEWFDTGKVSVSKKITGSLLEQVKLWEMRDITITYNSCYSSDYKDWHKTYV